MTIEVFADIWCPFAHVGLRAARAARDAGGWDVPIVVRAWPLELVNGAPMDPSKTRHHIEDLHAQIDAPMFADLADPFPTSTLPALALVRRAYRCDARLGERASFLIRDALFEHGQDISDPEVLAGLADELGCGLPDDEDRAGVLADWDDGTRRGVKGSPHFFNGDDQMFCPLLDISRDANSHLVIREQTQRLTEFLAANFG